MIGGVHSVLSHSSVYNTRVGGAVASIFANSAVSDAQSTSADRGFVLPHNTVSNTYTTME